MIKKVIFIGVLLLLLGFFYSLGKQAFDSLQVSHRVDEEIESLAKLQQKNLDLKKKLAEVGTADFIENQARDKLNMARPGETIMVIPQKELEKVLGVENVQKIEKIAHWQGWLRLFFK